jgi:membrane protease subunit (stomatin/prohibitin family)
MSKQRNIILSAAAGILIPAALTISAPAQSSEAGAFIGGVAASRIMGNMRRRTEAEEVQAYNSSRAAQPVQQAAPAPAPAPAADTTKQKLDQLDKLAAGGYITPQEYKAKKKAILDAM